MFNSESVLKSIARRVFPCMGAFSSDGEARVGLWDARLSVGQKTAWLTVSDGLDMLFQIRVQGTSVEATYALPAVMERSDGEKEYGTAWANSRRWCVGGWVDASEVSAEIREFFHNIDEFLEAEAEVYKSLERDE